MSSLDKINYRLLVAIALTMLFPSIYNTIKIYFIGEIPNTWGFNIASQIAWLNIIYEILQECILLPLFFIFGGVAHDKKLLAERFVYSIKIIIPIYLIITLLIWASSSHLVVLLNQKESLVELTTSYIRLETITIPFRVFVEIITTTLIIMNLRARIYMLLVFQVLARFLSDFIFVSTAGLNWGVIGVGYASMSAAVFASMVGLIITLKEFNFSKIAGSTQSIPKKEWFKVSIFSGLESAVRNIAFIVMILRLVNEVEKSGVFWVTNNFIWGWLLLPILALGSLIKQDVGVNKGLIGKRFYGYFLLTFAFVALWFVSIPGWDWFIENIMNYGDYSQISNLALFMTGFYIVFSLNNILASYLYGMGRTDLMLLQTLFVNLIYYVVAYILYLKGIFIPSLKSIAALFGVGITVGFIATIFLFIWAGYPTTQKTRNT